VQEYAPSAYRSKMLAQANAWKYSDFGIPIDMASKVASSPLCSRISLASFLKYVPRSSGVSAAHAG
jgi:hypothetical protein